MGHRDVWNFARGEGQLRASTACSHASAGVEEGDNSRVFVGGLPRWLSTHELWESFEVAFGKVTHAIVVCRIDETGEQRSRGFGFVRFRQQEDADEALKTRYVTLGGRRVEVKRAVPRLDDSPSGASTANSSGKTSQIAARLLSALAMTSSSPGIRRFHEVLMQQPTSPDFLRSPPVWSMPSLVQRSHDLFSPSQSSSIAHTSAYTSQPPVSRLNAQTNYSILQRPADGFREMTPPTKYTEVGQASNTSGYHISWIPGFNPHRPMGSKAISGNHVSHSLGVTAAPRGVLDSGGEPPSNVMRMFPPYFNNPLEGYFDA